MLNLPKKPGTNPFQRGGWTAVWAALITLSLLLQACRAPEAERTREPASGASSAQVSEAQAVEAVPMGSGQASYYGPGLAGNLTASGEPFRPESLTAAHRTLPFGSNVRVTNLKNDAAVVVRINDRGPFAGDRIIDVSAAAAERLGMVENGVADVRLELLKPVSDATGAPQKD